jgi:glycosyltransferase involved in cell wall biosynthesis
LVKDVTLFFSDPILSRTWLFNPDDNDINLSIVVPVFNQEQIICDVLESLVSSISMCSELIIINDGSEDQTQIAITKFFDDFRSEEFPSLVKVRLYLLKFSRFETYCDDFGIKISHAKYCLEVQADMFISDPGFDKRMVALMQAYPDLALLSGRGVEPLEHIIYSYQSSLGTEAAFFPSELQFLIRRSFLWARNVLKRIMARSLDSSTEVGGELDAEAKKFEVQSNEAFLSSGCAGRLGKLIDLSPNLSDVLPPRVYLGETVMRGPLLIDRDKYSEIGGFNSDLFFLGFDDHDFCFRANSLKFRVGYSPVHFYSPLRLGANRKHRTALSELLIFLNILRIRKLRLRSTFWTQRQPTKLDLSPPEIRYLL